MKNLFLKTWYFFFKNSPSKILGNVIYAVMPESLKKKCIENYFNRKGFIGFLTNAISVNLENDYYNKPESEIRKMNRELFWGGAYGKNWHENERSKYADIAEYAVTDSFVKFRKPLVDQIQQLFGENYEIKNVCEIGTGNGLFIDYLSKTLPEGINFFGLDINANTIYLNKKFFAKSKITFIDDSENKFLVNQLPNCTLIVSVGTLECFTQDELEEVLESIRSSGKKIALSLSEPFDLKNEMAAESLPRGATLFSHGYEYLLKKHQFIIRSKQFLKRKNSDEKNNYAIITATTF